MKRVFLIGYPVKHSLSPAMQNAAFRALNLDWEYGLLETPRDQLGEVVARIRLDDCTGANVTVPHKEAVMPYLDDIADHARHVGAVNTIIKRDGKLIGDNTDVYGIVQTLTQALVKMRGARVAILGAGGAAHAAAFALAESGAAHIVIVNRTHTRAAMLAERVRGEFPRVTVTANETESLARAQIIINATPVGMTPREGESPMTYAFPRHAVAFDLVYRPLQTRFLREAELAGARAIGGLGMLVHQGVEAFKLWTGYRVPDQIMLDAAMAELERARELKRGASEVRHVAILDSR
ncbi:MAG: shikimate dehydrogenase [Chloroflexi bacterium]|nr:shikimate dehydrogenase [Chloroflexota bacterium]